MSTSIKVLKEKTHIIKEFVKKYEYLSVQGTQEWLKERKLTIGGSEIATIIGKSKYSSIVGLVAEKISLTSFKGNTATRWGSLFEDMTQLIFKLLFLNERSIYTTGSVPHKIIKSHRYSPDGLCVIEINNNYAIILLEFKAPLCSIPENKIPSHYLPQIKSGLCTIDISEHGIFMSNMYRKCSIEQLNFDTTYDKTFHKDLGKKINTTRAIAYGIILFHIPGKSINEFLSLLLDDCEDEDILCSTDCENESDVYSDSENKVNNMKHEFAATESESESGFASDYEYLDNIKCEPNDDLSILKKLYKNVKLFLDTELNIEEYDLLDVGTFSNDDMEEWLNLYKQDTGNTFLEAKYIKPNFNIDAILDDPNMYISHNISYIKNRLYLNKICKKYNFIETIKKYKFNCLKNGLIPVAILPWKLMKSDIISVEKEEDYLKPHENKINDTVNIINNIINMATNKDEYANLLDDYYPDNTITKNYWDTKTLSKEEINEIINF